MADYERELNWDDEISQENEIITLPAGDYDFEVIKFERLKIRVEIVSFLPFDRSEKSR